MKPVPVLPAIDSPGTWACLAVPRHTTSRIIGCIWLGDLGLTTSRVADGRHLAHLAVGVDRRLDQLGRHVHAVVGDRVDGRDELDRAAGDALAVGDGVLLGALPLLPRLEDAGVLVGEVERRPLAEAERPHVVVLRSKPIVSDTVIVPMFDDSTRICSTFITSSPWTCESWSRSPRFVYTFCHGTTNAVSGVTVPSLSAPEIVITLPTEPGS